MHTRAVRTTGLLSAGHWATQQPPRAPSSRLSDYRPGQAPTWGGGGNRRLSPLAVHGDLGCPPASREEFRSAGSVCSQVLGPFHGYSTWLRPSTLAWLLPQESVLLAEHLSPGSRPPWELLLSVEGSVASVVRTGALGRQSRPARASLACSNPSMPLASWPPNCAPFQARRSRSGTTGRDLQFQSVGQEGDQTGRAGSGGRAYEIQHR